VPPNTLARQGRYYATYCGCRRGRSRPPAALGSAICY
jgi:hypothetical protein